MHPLILFDANEPGEFARAEELGGKILELCVEVGGSISGEHGIGREKINQMCAQFNSDEITTFHAVKAAFDPDGLLNPGKNIPRYTAVLNLVPCMCITVIYLSLNWSVSDATRV